jgi:homoserine dehydrogenase
VQLFSKKAPLTLSRALATLRGTVRTINIGVLGLGNVGAGALRILQDNRASIEARVGSEVRVKRVLVRDPQRSREVQFAPEFITTQASDIIDDPAVNVVVELIGGIDPARAYIMRALENGKHVVTANKALLAAHGQEIFALAAAKRLGVYFEGSVAGGIPVMRSLREGLASDRIERILGIINGTSNYVLDAMTRTGATYDDAVAAAQKAGFAEADPTLDVSGKDAAHKLALLAMVSFGLRVDPDAIPIEGISTVRPSDIRAARELGYVIKSLAIGECLDGELPCLRVHPTLVPLDHILAGVNGCFNAVLVRSRGLGNSMYYGQGAGMMPTGVAVVSDVIEACRDLASGTQGEILRGQAPGVHVRESSLRSLDDLPAQNYLCFHVNNRPGVLGRVAACLGRHQVSIQSMSQDSPDRGARMDMRIITERVSERQVVAALDELRASSDFTAPPDRIRILENDSE